MPDDFLTDAPSVGDGETFASDDDGTRHWTYVKLAWGADNTYNIVDAASGKSIPVTLYSPLGDSVIDDTADAVKGILQANSGVDIGDVDVTSVIPGVGATNLGKAEDAPHTSGDVGVMALGVRTDTQAPLGADGDYVPFMMDEKGSLWVHEEEAEVDATNSTTTPLGISGVFTGVVVSVLGHAAITVNIFSDVDSAADGIQLQLSSNGTDWDIDRPFTYTAANGGVFFQASAAAEFFRVVYTNGVTGQTAFRLQTILHHTTPVGGAHRLNDSEDPDSFSTLTKAAIVAQAGGTGDFVPIAATIGGSIKVSIEESNGNITGGGTEATALRVTIASDSTGLVSIDDNGGSLTVDNGGTFAVQADSVIPGTAATSLGKAIDSVVGATDTGVALLCRHQGDTVHLTTAEGDYDVPNMSAFGAVHVEPEQHHVLDQMDVTTGWAALNTDTTTLATTTKHVIGTAALSFAKVNGAANTVFGAIAKTITSTDLGTPSPHDIIQTVCYFSSVADMDYVFVRVGTDSSNYNEWRIPAADLTAATFTTLAFEIGDADYAGITGNGWDASAVTYIVVGAAFLVETDALSGIVFDELSFHTNQHVNASINSEVTSSVNSANVNLQKIAGSATDKGAGNVSNGSQRVVLATDDVNTALIAAGYNVAHDAADSGNPVKTGSKAVLFNQTAPPNAAAAEDDRVNHIADEYGRQYVETTHPNYWDVSVDYAAAQANATVKAAPGAGLSLHITDITCSNGATAGNITLLDGSAGTVKWEIYPAINGGATETRRTPIKLTANTLLAITSTTVTTHSLTISGFIAP